MTNSEHRTYEFVCAFIDQHGYSPSQREIARGIFYSRTTVKLALDGLRTKGLLDYQDATFRTIRVLKRLETV